MGSLSHSTMQRTGVGDSGLHGDTEVTVPGVLHVDFRLGRLTFTLLYTPVSGSVGGQAPAAPREQRPFLWPSRSTS